MSGISVTEIPGGLISVCVARPKMASRIAKKIKDFRNGLRDVFVTGTLV